LDLLAGEGFGQGAPTPDKVTGLHGIPSYQLLLHAKGKKVQQFPKTRNSKHSSGILTCLFVNRHAKMELSGYE